MYTDIRFIVPTAGAQDAIIPITQVLYDGLVIPPNSLLFFYKGQHSGASSTTLNDLTQAWPINGLTDLVVRNTSLNTSSIITTNTPVTAETSITFNDYNYYEIVADITANDIIEYETITQLGGTVVVNAKGIPTISSGISGGHAFAWRVFDEVLQEWTPFVTRTIQVS